jgi:uncharacterized protein
MPWDFWLILFLLGVIVPWRGHSRLRELLAKTSVASTERIWLYVSTITFQWLAVAVVAWRARARGLSPSQLGLVGRNAGILCTAAITGAVLIATMQWFNLRRASRMSEGPSARLRAVAQRILPQSARERVPFFALAVTAGICEEFLYRGFAMAAFLRTGLPLWTVIVLSSLLFGLAHLYQGRGGLIGATLLGLLFGVTRSVFGSLLPVTVWHIAVDVVAGIAGPRYLIHK